MGELCAGSTWLEINTEETFQPCTWGKILERIQLYLGVPAKVQAATDCQVFKDDEPDCHPKPVPHYEHCEGAYLGRMRGHDIPHWAQNW